MFGFGREGLSWGKGRKIKTRRKRKKEKRGNLVEKERGAMKGKRKERGVGNFEVGIKA